MIAFCHRVEKAREIICYDWSESADYLLVGSIKRFLLGSSALLRKSASRSVIWLLQAARPAISNNNGSRNMVQLGLRIVRDSVDVIS